MKVIMNTHGAVHTLYFTWKSILLDLKRKKNNMTYTKEQVMRIIGDNEGEPTSKGKTVCDCPCLGPFCTDLIHPCNKPNKHILQRDVAVIEIQNGVRDEQYKRLENMKPKKTIGELKKEFEQGNILKEHIDLYKLFLKERAKALKPKKTREVIKYC